MTTDFPTAPSAYGLNGPSATVTVEKSIHASHTEILTPPQLHILHPLLCLKSRIENLRALPSKRNGNGISQAQVAVEVARKYIRALLSQPTERDAINAVHQIKDMAWSRAGLFVFKEYGIDLLRAVEPEKFHSIPFREKDWPNILRWITDRRNRSGRTALRLESMALAKKYQG